MSISSNISTPQMSYRDPYAAWATANSPQELKNWWNSVKFKEPFNQVVADRMDSEPNRCLLRVGSEYQNEGKRITHIFKSAGIPCLNVPPFDILDCILKNLQKTYHIQGKPYQITKLISTRGCYGDVFLAHDQTENKNVVIKILRYEQDREASMLKKLAKHGSHPNIVQYIGSDTIMDKIWIVMEYIDGILLGEYQGPWTQDLKAQYNSALDFISEAGVEIERDNEKENAMIVMVEGKPTLKLIDFGTLAKS